jgi:hypothetical protein
LTASPCEGFARGTFRLLEPDRYDPDAATWEFPPLTKRAASRESSRRVARGLGALDDTLVAELDINPLMVLPSGQGPKAVDALVVFRGI